MPGIFKITHKSAGIGTVFEIFGYFGLDASYGQIGLEAYYRRNDPLCRGIRPVKPPLAIGKPEFRKPYPAPKTFDIAAQKNPAFLFFSVHNPYYPLPATCIKHWLTRLLYLLDYYNYLTFLQKAIRVNK